MPLKYSTSKTLTRAKQQESGVEFDTHQNEGFVDFSVKGLFNPLRPKWTN